MPTPITPSVGRKVWFYGGLSQSEPWDATVVKVHAAPADATPTTPVNLSIIRPDTGQALFLERVVFHDDSESFDGERFTWMPYQTASAAKALAPGEQSPVNAIETKTYTDGTSATGPGPLPDQSPAQQDAAEENTADLGQLP